MWGPSSSPKSSGYSSLQLILEWGDKNDTIKHSRWDKNHRSLHAKVTQPHQEKYIQSKRDLKLYCEGNLQFLFSAFISLCWAHGGVIWFTKNCESSCGANKLSKGSSPPAIICHPQQPQIASTLKTGMIPSSHLYTFLENHTCNALEESVLQSVNEFGSWFGEPPLQITIMRL